MTHPAPLNILVSTPTFLPVVGGAELGIHEIYQRLGERHRVTIMTPRHRPSLVAAYGANDERTTSYDVHHLGAALDRLTPALAGRALKRTSLPYIAAIRQLSKARRFDVANFHFLAPHGAALIYARRRLQIPVALSLVGRSDVTRALAPPRRVSARVTLAAANVVLPISAYYRADLQGDSPSVVTIPYGVDVQEYSPQRRSEALRKDLGLASDTFLLLAVQRLSRVKQVDVVLRAFAVILSQCSDMVLVIVGKGDERGRLEALARELGVIERVRFTGYVDEAALPSYFASADAFVCHSAIETFGIVFAQAMASGLPIIAARTSCVPYVVSPRNGILVAPGDLKAFADAVVQLARDRPLREAFAHRNRTRACAEFDWESIASAYEDVLLGLARARA